LPSWEKQGKTILNKRGLSYLPVLPMACIWKHPKSVNWFARYRGAEGKTINRSTGTRSRSDAELIARSWEIEAARERNNQRPDISPSGISDAIARAERLAREGRLDAGTARDLISDLLRAAGQESLDAITHRKWCDSWIASRATSIKKRSKMKYEQSCRDWLAFLKQAADKPLETATELQAVAYRDRLANEGLSPGTINQTIKILRGVYKDALVEGYVARNPFVGVGSLRDDTDDSKRLPFTQQEVVRLIDHAKGDWKGLVILAATTGLRLMDASRLRWAAIDFDKRIIRIKTAKTGVSLALPMHSSFIAWLRKQPRGIGAAPIFPSLIHKSGAGKSGLSMAFKRLMNRAAVSAGVARQAKAGGRGRTTSQKCFHCFRHFTASQLAAAGVRAEIARQITGHVDVHSHANYINADLDVLRSAVKSIRLSA
jgi:integrase